MTSKRTNRQQGAGSPQGESLRVVGYVRVSTDEQADSGAGLAAQRTAITEAAASRGFELVAIVEDAGWSGKSMDRPGIAEVLELIESGGADALVVSKLDRLSRSLVDFASLMERARRKRWALIALDLGVDTTTPAGELVANVMASVAQWERRAIGARTREAMAAKRAAGVHVGRPRSLPEEIVARVVTAYQSGENRSEIARALNADGVPTAHGGLKWHPSTVRSVLISAGVDLDN
ncbi:MAG TPA: recombinase family protein [Acidimicrobiales bacterium]|jgi:DNA invertase Pin-like site-specific DNA recombinase|nr:recombinase family protein [Acidimicrobiales bacterium]